MALQKVKILFPEGFTEQDEILMTYRGYLSHVRVTVEDGNTYPVYFVDPVRLQQNMEFRAQGGRPFFAEPGLIVLPQVTMERIKNVVESLAENGFFAFLRPINESSEQGE